MSSETPRIGHAPIVMRKVAPKMGLEDPENGLHQAGDFLWDVRGERRKLILAIPMLQRTSQGRGWVYSQWTIDHPNAGGAQWSWDRNEDKPTLSPSLHAVGLWHGWVRDGMLVEA